MTGGFKKVCRIVSCPLDEELKQIQRFDVKFLGLK